MPRLNSKSAGGKSADNKTIVGFGWSYLVIV